MLFRYFTRKMVPAAAHAGVKFVELTDEKCVIKMPYRKRNRNPFRSMYFAVQSMAAEMSTALPILILLEGYRESVAWIVVDFNAQFPKKATGDVTFTSSQVREINETLERAIQTNEGQTLVISTQGVLDDGTVVSQFDFTWSFKRR